jgi:hypothetical protein
MTREGTPPTDESAPLEVRIRQGIPTRLDIDGVRWRFGLNTSRYGEQSVHFSVHSGDDLVGFDVRQGDEVDMIGRHWRVRELNVPESGTTRVVLEEVPESAG